MIAIYRKLFFSKKILMTAAFNEQHVKIASGDDRQLVMLAISRAIHKIKTS